MSDHDMTTQSGPEGMADLLAAHQSANYYDWCSGCDWTRPPGISLGDVDAHAAHQTDVLTAAGYGDIRALKDFAQAAIDALAAYYTLARRHGIPENHARHIWNHQEHP